MSRPANATTAGALVFIASALLIAQPFAPHHGSAAGATSDEPDGAASVTGQRLDSHYFQAPAGGPGAVDSGRFEMSDERLSGDVTFVVDGETLRTGTGREMFLYWGTMVIVNDGGTWEGTHFAAEHHAQPDVEPGPLVMQLAGSGDYEGLSAILYLTVAADASGESLDGMIFLGDLPPDREHPDRA